MPESPVSRSQQSVDPVTVPWLEWHNTREELKEARRLLGLVLEHEAKGENIDVGQIKGFLR